MFRMNAAYLLPVALLLACHAKESDSDTDLSVDTAIPLATGIQWFDEVRPADITPNGRTVLVQVTTSLAGELRFIDTETGDMRRITDLGDATADLATGLSADLKVSAFYGYPVQAGVWSERTDWVGIASPYSEGCTDNIGAGWDISDDGSVVVGFMWDECAPLAFRQVDGGTVQILETLGDPSGGSSAHPTNRATVVSGDGQISAGFASHGSLDRSPAFWNAAGEGTLIDPKTQDVPGEILAIDRDGSTLVGVRGYDGFVWTPRVDSSIWVGRTPHWAAIPYFRTRSLVMAPPCLGRSEASFSAPRWHLCGRRKTAAAPCSRWSRRRASKSPKGGF